MKTDKKYQIIKLCVYSSASHRWATKRYTNKRVQQPEAYYLSFIRLP